MLLKIGPIYLSGKKSSCRNICVQFQILTEIYVLFVNFILACY
jgi:hypothetical protein